jgi:hypothetical protein
VRLERLDRLPKAIVPYEHLGDDIAAARRVEAGDPLDVTPLVERHIGALDRHVLVIRMAPSRCHSRGREDRRSSRPVRCVAQRRQM